MKNNTPKSTAKEFAKQVIRHALDFEVKLRFSEQGIADAEDILEQYRNRIIIAQDGPASEQITEYQIWKMSLAWGCFVGQIIKKKISRKYSWVEGRTINYDLKSLHLQHKNNHCIYPVEQVHKRLIDGRKHSILDFYEYIRDSTP